MTQQAKVAVIGGGLAGSEAALQLANRNIPVTLYEMKPLQRSAAHHNDNLAEIVCSNSFGNLTLNAASGLIKEELRLLDCQLIQMADKLAVPAGNALAVDRDQFSQAITNLVDAHPLIERKAENITSIPTDVDYTIIATGPLTSPELVQTLQTMLNEEQLYFFDAAAPILTKDSINFDIAFFQDRYHKSASEQTSEGEGSYINCPFNKEQYLALIDFITQAEKTALKAFEEADMKKAKFFESCLPIEELARRGVDTPRYGPMKPVGITDPNTGKQPYAVVQLRQDNLEGTLYNMVGFQTNIKWGSQKEMIHLIPGLEKADVVRYGVMHRNTFLNSPKVLHPTMQLRNFPNILIAGQLTGVEGYTECIASGLMAALTVSQLLQGSTPLTLPLNTMMGALFAYITREGVSRFQPINSNWGILPAFEEKIRDKKLRNQRYAERALDSLKATISQNEYLEKLAVVERDAQLISG